jgi:hypothetical protein
MGRLSIGKYLNLHLLDDDFLPPTSINCIQEFNGRGFFTPFRLLSQFNELQRILLLHKENKHVQETIYSYRYADRDRRIV